MSETDYIRAAQYGGTCTIEDRGPSVRLYCQSSDPSFALQVRTRVSLVNGQESQRAIAATASLSLDDLRALRDAIDTLIAEHEHRAKPLAARVG